MRQTAAALCISREKLPRGYIHNLIACAHASPHNAITLSLRCWRNSYQPTKCLPCQICDSRRNFCFTAAIPDCPSLQGTGIQQAFPAAIAAALPNHVAAFPLFCGGNHFQLSNSVPDPYRHSLLHHPCCRIAEYLMSKIISRFSLFVNRRNRLKV